MRFDFLTLFPEICEVFLTKSIIGRAEKKGLVEFYYHHIRDYAFDKHKRVDDTPYGGGKGMLMIAEPIAACFENICSKIEKRPKLIYMSPRGKILNQEKAKKLSKLSNIAILCGRYEGIDQRFIDAFVDEEISIGNYVVTGGELPGLILADSIIRLLPGVLSSEICYEDESHFDGKTLEYPQYTKPAIWRGRSVPEVLLSGHHANILEWKNSMKKNIHIDD
ncbi:MAG: tRNA (guanosine(37)-N1)-methyltransferase TrmD [Oscillospiraceae bacterium]|jgi:tRNA (guanine37-N1)-methyltransferase|nr:tRNA (guanosine(37)-N1)-methyltransferase TrmD [Oscillospiraceae bacterium]